jgi:hypothetical protein
MVSLQPDDFQSLDFGTVDVAEFADCTPPVALQVTVTWQGNVNSEELSHQLSRLFGLISQQEKHLGGMGMVLDADECKVSHGQFKCLLRFLDLRGSAERGTQLSKFIVQSDPAKSTSIPDNSFLESIGSIVMTRFPSESSDYNGKWMQDVTVETVPLQHRNAA